MSKKYNYVVKFTIAAICKTPFRVGNNENDIETVQKYNDGVPFISGTSIAGVFRNYLETVNCKQESVALLGGNGLESKIVVSDGVFSKYNEVIRPRVRIDENTGSTVKGGKFDIAHIETGSIFSFSLTWLGMKDDLKEVDTIYNILKSLNDGDISFGGQKTNGFGKVDIKASEQKIDLTIENDRNNWLNNTGKKQLIRLDKLENQNKLEFTTFEIIGRTENLLVKSSQNVIENNTTYAVNIKENNKYIVPASSIKGAIKSRALAILENITGDLEEATATIGTIFGDEENAGKVIFEDVILENTKTANTTRIRINKFTGGVIGSGLFSEKPICGDFKFIIKIPNHIENKDVACKIMSLVLRDLSVGLFNIGGNKSIGRGDMAINLININSDNKESVIKIDKNRKISLIDKEDLISNWFKEGIL